MDFNIEIAEIANKVATPLNTGVHKVKALSVSAREIKGDRTLLEFKVGNDNGEYDITLWQPKDEDNVRGKSSYNGNEFDTASNVENTMLSLNLCLMAFDPSLAQRTSFTSWADKDGIDDEGNITYDADSVVGYAISVFKDSKGLEDRNVSIKKEAESLEEEAAKELLSTIVDSDVFNLKLAVLNKKGLAVHSPYIGSVSQEGKLYVGKNKSFISRGWLALTPKEQTKINTITNAKPTEVKDDFDF